MDPIIIVTEERLRQILAEALAGLKAPATQHGWLTRQEAAAELGISPSTLDARVRRGSIRATYVGSRMPRFSREELARFMSGQKLRRVS